jgi:threonyl-tRNA synthetase
MILKNSLLDYWHKIHREHGYLEVETPTILSRELWETSGHWEHYKENMYTTKIDGKDFAIKPMNCPGAILVYKNDIHSYKDLPLRYAELGHVHRHEASGALNGLFRVRAFTQDDAHIMIRPDQIESEVKAIMALFDEVYNVFGSPTTSFFRPVRRKITSARSNSGISRSRAGPSLQRFWPHLRNQPGRRRLLWPEARLQTQGFDGTDLAMRHDSARCQPAAPLRLLLHR